MGRHDEAWRVGLGMHAISLTILQMFKPQLSHGQNDGVDLAALCIYHHRNPSFRSRHPATNL